MVGVISANNAYQNNAAAVERAISASEVNKDTQQGLANEASDSISISDDAIEQYTLSQNIAEAESFIPQNQNVIYEKTLIDFNSYPQNLASQLDSDSTLSTEERSEIQNLVNQREFEAFAKYAKQSPPDLEAYYENYIEYLDSLSPQERQSERYRGQREAVVPLYESAARDNGSQPRDFSMAQDPILSLFEALEAREFKVEDRETFRQQYFSSLSALFDDSENGQAFVQEAEFALNNFVQTDNAIAAALSGNREALNAITELVNGTLSADDFLNLEFTPPPNLEDGNS